MSLKNQHELEVTRQKLQLLEQQYTNHLLEPSDNHQTRELSQRSLKKLINQLKEEIARFEAQSAVSG